MSASNNDAKNRPRRTVVRSPRLDHLNRQLLPDSVARAVQDHEERERKRIEAKNSKSGTGRKKKGKKKAPAHSSTMPKYAALAEEVYETPSKRKARAGYQYVRGGKRQGIWYNTVLNEAVVAIRGTDPTSGKDLIDDVGIASGTLKLTPRYRVAKKWVKSAIKKYGKKNVVVVGHSLGGALSKALGRSLGVRAKTFNAGASWTDVVGNTADKLTGKKRKNEEHFRVISDPISIATVSGKTNTISRKKGKDPHSISNFVKEGVGRSNVRFGHGSLSIQRGKMMDANMLQNMR